MASYNDVRIPGGAVPLEGNTHVLTKTLNTAERICHPPKQYASQWHLLGPGTQQFIKGILFPILCREESPQVATFLAQFIGELAATIKAYPHNIGQEIRTWDEMLPNVWQLVHSDDEKSIVDGFKVMSILIKARIRESFIYEIKSYHSL